MGGRAFLPVLTGAGVRDANWLPVGVRSEAHAAFALGAGVWNVGTGAAAGAVDGALTGAGVLNTRAWLGGSHCCGLEGVVMAKSDDVGVSVSRGVLLAVATGTKSDARMRLLSRRGETISLPTSDRGGVMGRVSVALCSSSRRFSTLSSSMCIDETDCTNAWFSACSSLARFADRSEKVDKKELEQIVSLTDQD
jgi:hypothetical protein